MSVPDAGAESSAQKSPGVLKCFPIFLIRRFLLLSFTCFAHHVKQRNIFACFAKCF